VGALTGRFPSLQWFIDYFKVRAAPALVESSGLKR
jgi:hypothetical protein